MINKKIGLLEYEESYLTQSFFIFKNRSRIHDDLRDIYIYIYNMIKQVKKASLGMLFVLILSIYGFF